MNSGTQKPSYDEAYYKGTFIKEVIRWGGPAWWSIRFYAALAARRLNHRGGRRVLDVGCAHGHVLARLEERFETYGIDLSEYAVAKSRTVAPRSRIVQGDIESGVPPELGDLQFDLIIARYILEHLKDPAATLRHLAPAIAPGGAMLISVPNTSSPGRRWKGDGWFAFRDPTHVSLWSPERWIDAAENASFKIEAYCSDGLWDVPYLPTIPPYLQYFMFSIPAAVQVVLGRPILPVSWGENLVMIAAVESDRPKAERAGSNGG